MAIRANVNPGYRRKLLIIGGFITLFGLWAAYDVFVTYPPQFEKYNAFLALKEEGRQSDWPELARTRGWPEEEPKVRNQGHFNFNYALMGFGLLVGSYVLYQGLTAGKRWIILEDDDTLRTYTGRQTPLAKVKELNDSRWKSKGIAVVSYEDDAGRRQRIVLDDFNYETAPTREIFDKVNAELSSREAASNQAPAESQDPKPETPADE